MKKIIFTAILLYALNTHAQVNNKSLSCNGQEFPFAVQFSGNYVTATFKGYAHKVPYQRSFIGKKGETWFVYANDILDVSIVPNENYVVLMRSPNSAPDIIASSYCR